MTDPKQFDIICSEWNEWKQAHLVDSNKWLLAIQFQLLKDELDDLSNLIQMAIVDNDIERVIKLTEQFEILFKKFKDSIILEMLKNE